MPKSYDPEALPFEHARARITPLCQAYRFRLIQVVVPEAGQPHGFCEFSRGDFRLRLVWEGEAKALWLESARHVAGQVVGRWTDIEWSRAREQPPLDRDASDGRIDRLELALAAFVLQSFPKSSAE